MVPELDDGFLCFPDKISAIFQIGIEDAQAARHVCPPKCCNDEPKYEIRIQ